MATYQAPIEDAKFVLHNVLRIHEKSEIEGYSDLTDDMTGAIFEEAGKIATEVLLPINEAGDKQGCVLENGVVRTPEGFKEAYQAQCEGGWPGIDQNPEYGGQGMPYIIHSVTGEFSSSAAMAFTMYTGLTHGAVKAIEGFGSDQQKQTYLPKMISGEWTGTMNLTEPHCGTDLGMMRTKAEPQDDGSYKITGQKIFISSGEHDMADTARQILQDAEAANCRIVLPVDLVVAQAFAANWPDDDRIVHRTGADHSFSSAQDSHWLLDQVLTMLHEQAG